MPKHFVWFGNLFREQPPVAVVELNRLRSSAQSHFRWWTPARDEMIYDPGQPLWSSTPSRNGFDGWGLLFLKGCFFFLFRFPTFDKVLLFTWPESQLYLIVQCTMCDPRVGCFFFIVDFITATLVLMIMSLRNLPAARFVRSVKYLDQKPVCRLFFKAFFSQKREILFAHLLSFKALQLNFDSSP